jgi:hypothetical protein
VTVFVPIPKCVIFYFCDPIQERGLHETN